MGPLGLAWLTSHTDTDRTGGAWMELVHTLLGLSRGGASSAFWQVSYYVWRG